MTVYVYNRFSSNSLRSFAKQVNSVSHTQNEQAQYSKHTAAVVSITFPGIQHLPVDRLGTV